MKSKVFLSALISLCFLNFMTSCKKTNEVLVQSLLLSPTVQNLSSNESFINLIKLNDETIYKMEIAEKTNPKYYEVIKKYYGVTTLTYAELSETAATFGYKNAEDYRDALNKKDHVTAELKQLFSNINSVSVDSIKTAINIIHENLRHKEYAINYMQEFFDPRLCSEILDNCKNQASAVYTTEILACTAGAIGVGSVTLGFGGVIFQIACGATAMYHLGTMRSGCDLAYKNCH